MKTFAILLAALFIISAMAQPNCLLQDPLTDRCIESIAIETVQQQLAQYLCTISYGRKIYVKAEQFCGKSVQSGDETAYKYFNSLLANKKLVSALKTDYMLFFAKPFDHNSKLTASIEQMSQLLTNMLSNSEQLSKLNDFEKAILYFYLKETEKSLDHLTSYLSLHKQDKTLIYQHLLKLRILQKQYKYYQALQYVQKVIKSNSKLHPYIYHLKGNLLMHHIQFRKAIPQFQKANTEFHNLYKSNGFSFTNYNIGLCYQKLGDLEHAIKYYEKSIINLPSAEALNALGHAHYSSFEKTKNKKSLEVAETYYKKSLQTKPQYKITIFNLGMLELERSNLKQAISYFQRCSDSIRSCKYGLIKAYYKGNNTAPVEGIIASIDKNQQIITQLAAILYQMGDHAKALEIIGDKEYKSSELYQWKGFNEYALDKYELAESSFARAIFLGNKKGSTYYSLGLTQLHLKKYSQCAVSLDHAYKLDPRKDTKQQLQTCRKMQKQSDL